MARCSAEAVVPPLGKLSEVVEALPFHIKLAGAAMRRAAPDVPFPHLPNPGEELNSWYVFDFFATDSSLARELMGHVANTAIDQGIDYCYLPHLPGDSWISAVRADVPHILSPSISYHLLMTPAVGCPIRADLLYVDFRDLRRLRCSQQPKGGLVVTA